MPSSETSGMRDVFITACGAYLPGEPISNDEMEVFLGKVSGTRSRIKRKILESNGITSRHYALDREGHTTELNEQLASRAVELALAARGMDLSRVEMLALGTSLPDVLFPGFASMVQGRLRAPAMEVLSTAGVCCSGIAAMQAAYRALRSNARRVAIAGGSEVSSRGLRASRFEFGAPETEGENVDFDSEFLRWMLSDGAGVALLEQRPRPEGLSLRIDWMDLVSRAGETIPCMYAGVADARRLSAGESWLDQPTVAGAERGGMLRIRQDFRMLDRMIETVVEHWLQLVRAGWIVSNEIDHVLCHYSSQLLGKRLVESLTRAEIMPSSGKWFSNLTSKGNTGSAAIFIAIEELLVGGTLREGERILLMVPESARFASCFAHLTVVSGAGMPANHEGAAEPGPALTRSRVLLQPAGRSAGGGGAPAEHATDDVEPPPGQDAGRAYGVLHKRLLLDLALVWSDFNALLHQVPIMKRIDDRTVTREDYRNLLRHLRQQVVDGSCWIMRAASSTSPKLAWLRTVLIQHAEEEHRDYELLEQDYMAMGGTLEEIQSTPKNLGSEALSAFVFQRASLTDPVDLAGVMFVIEGLGQRVAGRMVKHLREALALHDDQTRFLRYHAERDASHLGHLDEAVSRLELDPALCERIVRTARVAARLYVLQLEEIDHEQR